LNITALFSGGKDSTYAIYKAKLEGHNVSCLVTVFPISEESKFLHYPNINMTTLQATSMKIPHIYGMVNSNDIKTESAELEKLLIQARKDFDIEGVVHGGILSEFQKHHFEKIAKKLNLQIISPLWKIDQKKYLTELIESKFHFIITSVSSDGLDDFWLGREISNQDIEKLDKLATQHGFNLSFEGGEAETLVIDCPLFSDQLKIVKSKKIWDGYRGRFEITEAILSR